jgi:hypothetical protein
MTIAYLIDPFARGVRRVELASEPSTFDELHEIYALLDCEVIESAHPYNAGRDLMYIDENGKINGHAQEFFVCRLWPHDAIAGKALWIGATPDGNNTDPEMTIDYVRDHIVWSYLL